MGKTTVRANVALCCSYLWRYKDLDFARMHRHLAIGIRARDRAYLRLVDLGLEIHLHATVAGKEQHQLALLTIRRSSAW